jgi:hypothetical protein
VAGATYRLVEACSGTGDLVRAGAVVQRVRYRLDRYQGMMEASGLPIPGLHRLEGTVESEAEVLPPSIVGADLTLRLEDGRSVGITVVSQDGSILAEGHGPGRGCSCC